MKTNFISVLIILLALGLDLPNDIADNFPVKNMYSKGEVHMSKLSIDKQNEPSKEDDFLNSLFGERI